MEVCTISTGSSGNAYIVSSNNNYIILDCGVKFQDITHHPKFPKFSKIDFVFVSHCHRWNGDHNKSLKDFKRTGCETLTYETLKPEVQLHRIGDWDATTFPIVHNVNNWGIILKHNTTNEKLCYMTDFCKAPMIEGIDTFIFEVNYIESLIDETIDADKDLKHLGFNNHCSLEYAVDYFTRMNTRPKEIYCCHGSQSHSIKKKVYEGMRQFADKVVVL